MADHHSAQLDWLNNPVATADTAATLCAGFPENMVLLDCETTGLKPTIHRIIEVALLIVEQGKIIEQWQTLIDPSAYIPQEIQRLTGITPDKLKRAPVFADIADELLQRLQGRVLVAHNARFDYGFLKNEFSRVGIRYSTKPLCSVKISRQLFPQHQRHGLSDIIRRFNFSINNRHRALDDTLMIWKFFLQISTRFDADKVRLTCDQLLQRPSLPIHLDAAEIEKLPNTPGVYYFYGSNDQLLYIGKSVNLRNRVLSHFTQDHRNSKDLAMSALITHIDFETTPSDFGAQLRESQQIKELNPYYNRRLRKARKLWHYQIETDAAGYLRLSISPLDRVAGVSSEMDEQFGLFRSRSQAEARLGKLAEHFFLCQKLCGLQGNKYANDEPCFAYQLKRCLGACCQQESPQAYNQRVQIALQNYRQKAWPWADAILVEERAHHQHEGLSEPQTCWHLIHEWRYLAKIRCADELDDYGYRPCDTEIQASQKDDSTDNLFTHANDTEENLPNFDLDTYQILVRFLLDSGQQKANRLRILPLSRFNF
ncbi:MAG: exonuclease domain-containing protein [Thiolinea sp.]